MFYRLKEGRLKDITSKAIKKAGTIYKLAEIIKISKSALSDYKNEKRRINSRDLELLLRYLKIRLAKSNITEALPDNWKQVKGGKECVKLKKRKGTFEESLIKARKKQSEKLRKWHKSMKTEKPEEYYKIQYNRFKKIGKYKLKTIKGEPVRNSLEKKVADILYKLKISYEYEPLVKSKEKYFFPDFLINNKIILECTMWRGNDKAVKLKEKIEFLKENYKVYVIVPKSLNNYYKILNNHLILDDKIVPVAQTFRDDKKLEKEQ